MRLRKPCEHGNYDAHAERGWPVLGNAQACPGGEFLPKDTLVITPETIDGHNFWPVWAVATIAREPRAGAEEILDALADSQVHRLGPDPLEDFEDDE